MDWISDPKARARFAMLCALGIVSFDKVADRMPEQLCNEARSVGLVPKDFPYAVIGFSFLTEAANQMGCRYCEKVVTSHNLRDRATGLLSNVPRAIAMCRRRGAE